MDELRISSRFMKSVISKIASKMLSKKLGTKVDIKFSDINITVLNGNAHVHLELDGDIDERALRDLMRKSGLED